ncbi:Hypothetical protein, putative [Bodo saltans]|uniref:Membrane-associated protein n=1 Tax=Bodo saltans TaxID=75058 RepID=A0A0S4J571_BODSA|nr:Hypothetical protein, putative [Bodo saltans]|eukprot:CUG27596.1 Hypothetical protein, putative [Bodo saltans]
MTRYTVARVALFLLLAVMLNAPWNEVATVEKQRNSTIPTQYTKSNAPHSSPPLAHSSRELQSKRTSCKGSWRLPPNQTRFCRAYDATSAIAASRLRRIRIPTTHRKLLCDASSPAAMMKNCSLAQCHGAPDCLLRIPSPHCPHAAVLLPFSLPVHIKSHRRLAQALTQTLAPSLTLEERALGTFDGYPVARIQQCADLAMQSYCEHFFQLLPPHDNVCSDPAACHNRTQMLRCVAFRYHHYSRGTSKPMPNQPIFGFLHRSEWRPSLLRDDLRLAVLHGPDTTFRANRDGHQTPRVKIGVRGVFGEVVPLGLRVHIVVTLFVSECMGDAGAGNRTVLVQQAREWVSPRRGTAASLDPASSEVEFNVGVVNFGPWIGCKLTLRAVGEPQELASGAELPPLVKEVHSMLQYDSEAVRLAHELVPGEAATRRGSGTCAPYLRADECCLNGMTAFHVGGGEEGRPLSRAAFGGKWEETAVYLRVTPSAGGHEHPCISIVDGHLSSFEFHGVAVFPWLVVRNRCTPQEMASYALTNDTGEVHFELRKVQGNIFVSDARAVLKLTVFNDCGTSTLPLRSSLMFQNASSRPMYKGIVTRPLVSISAHQSLDALREQLQNIAAFVPSSVVIIHLSPSWNVDMKAIVRLNGTAHPFIILNPNRYRHSKQKLAQVQLAGARYVAEALPWVAWTHVILFASNELFVRAGVEEHLQHYDISFPGRPRPRQAISVMHSFNMSRPDIRFVDPGDFERMFDFWGLARGEGDIHGEFAFNRMLRTLGLTRYATHQLVTEGTFYNRSIAVRLSRVLDAFFDEDDGDCIDSFLSVSEAFLLQILQSSCGVQNRSLSDDIQYNVLRDPTLVPPKFVANEAALLMQELRTAHCGDKTGTVSWLNSDWIMSENDVIASRCSPFEGPFSFKRFSRLVSTPVRAFVEAIGRNPRQVSLLREDSEMCGQVRWSLQR